jgi:hypothetical protein
LTNVSGDEYSRTQIADINYTSGSTYKGGSLSRVVTDLYDSTQTKDTKIYRTYNEDTNSNNIILSAGCLYGFSLWYNEYHTPDPECKNFMYRTTQSAQSTKHYRTGFYTTQGNVTATSLQTYANIVTAAIT